MNWCQLNRASLLDADNADLERIDAEVRLGLEEDVEVVASGVENTGDVDFGFI